MTSEPVVQRLLTAVESVDDMPIGKSFRTVTGVSLLFVVLFSCRAAPNRQFNRKNLQEARSSEFAPVARRNATKHK